MKKLIAAVSAALLIAGCLGKPGDAPFRYFSIVTEPVVEPATSGIPKSLWIVDFLAADRYGYEILHRTDPYGIGYEQFDRWVERPEDMTRRVFATVFEERNFFKEVVFGIATAPTDYILEGYVLQFDEIRADSIWTARFSVKLTLSEPLERRIIWSDLKTVEKPLEFNQSGGFAMAMSAAVLQSAKEALEDIEAILRRENEAPLQ